jgi:hypothetical protein
MLMNVLSLLHHCHIQDDEVDRLERASKAACATRSRQEELEHMYGKAEPRPTRMCHMQQFEAQHVMMPLMWL